MSCIYTFYLANRDANPDKLFPAPLVCASVVILVLSLLDASGLFLSLKNALFRLGISDVDAKNCKKLVGIGSDGASANIAKGVC